MRKGRVCRGHGAEFGNGAMCSLMLAAAVMFLVFLPSVSLASHTGQSPYYPNCYPCHTLKSGNPDNGGAVPNSHYLNPQVRTVNDMQNAGWQGGMRVGCTFCHWDDSTTKMKKVLDHFQGTKSMHPVGKRFSTASPNPGGNTAGEYLSTLDSATSNEMDCVDCHDPALLAPDASPPYTGTSDPEFDYYADHVVPTDASRTNNRYMLRGVTAKQEFDGLCTGCHASTTGYSKKNAQVQRHATTSANLKEDDGTPFRTKDIAQARVCTECHDSHYSSESFRLLNDGHYLDNTTGTQTDHPYGAGTLITSSDCTSVCHYPGDESLNYENHGHGMAQSTYKYSTLNGLPVPGQTSGNYIDMNLACSGCHTVLDPLTHAVTNPTGTTQEKYKARYNLQITLQSTDSTGSPFGNPVVGICFQCHSTYQSHAGGKGGCTDCHDEHAEGSGTGSNKFMIPLNSKSTGTYVTPTKTKNTAETVTYVNARFSNTTNFDFYRGTNTDGVCDNNSCHTGKSWWTGTSLQAVVGTNGTHTQGFQDPYSDCNACHKHRGDTGGAWTAYSSCTDCHGTPPFDKQASGYTQHFEQYTPHAKHAASDEYAFNCRECHAKYTTKPPHDSGSYESVWFGTYYAPMGNGTTGYPSTLDYNSSAETCSNIYCHSNGSSTSAVGTATWMTGVATPDYRTVDLACNVCHAYPPSDTNHNRHMSYSSTGKGTVGCQHCHYTTTTTGTSISSKTLHVKNRAKDVAAGGTFNTYSVSFTYSSSARTCASASCHGGVQFTAITASWSDATSSCTNCHNDGTDDGSLANAYPLQGEHVVHAGAQPTNYGYACTRCHVYNSPMSTHAALDKTISVTFASNFIPGGTFGNTNNDCSNTYCHGTNAVPDWDAGGTVTCNSCHGSMANTQDGRPNSPLTGGRHGNISGTITNTHEAQSCTKCHYNNDTSTANHAQGPAQYENVSQGWKRSDARMGTIYTIYNAQAPSTDWGFSYTLGTCNNMGSGCHESATAGVIWGGEGGCSSCHGYPPNVGKHTAGHATADLTTCEPCHTGATGYTGSGSGNGQHLDSEIDVAAAIGWNGNGTLSTSNGSSIVTGNVNDDTCTAACHVRETASWGSAAVISCNACHYWNSDPTQAGNTGNWSLDGGHNLHFNNSTGHNSVCTDCHATTTADNAVPRTHLTGSQYYQAQLRCESQPLEAALTTAALGSRTRAAVVGTQTCNNVLCHNPSNDATHVSTSWNATAQTSCTTCHDYGASVSNLTGDHPIHVNSPRSLGCVQCHNPVPAADGHSTQSIHLANASGSAIAYNGDLNSYPGTYGACTTNICHSDSIGANIAWNAAPTTCSQCHTVSGSGSDVNNFAGNDGVASKVSSAEWTAYGHGAKAAVGNNCTYCHSVSTAIPHDTTSGLTGSNPFRLTGSASQLNNFCSNPAAGCHQAVSSVKNHDQTVMDPVVRTWPSAPAWTPKCVDCHDAHGDLTNLAMIGSDVNDTGSTTGGVPSAGKTTDVIDFTTKGGLAAGSYADLVNANGQCQECHTAINPAPILNFRDGDTAALNTNGGNHPTTGLAPCISCHSHDGGFKASGCNGCHGGETATGATVAGYWPDGTNVGGDNATADNKGVHRKHVEELALKRYTETITELLTDYTAKNALLKSDEKQKEICQYCHAPGTDFDHGNSANLPAEVFLTTVSGSSTRFSKTTWNTADADAAYTAASYNCTNTVNCHDNKATNGGAIGYSWYSGQVSACVMCHNDVPNEVSPTGSHSVHLTASLNFGQASVCANCHNSATSWSPAVEPGTNHYDGTFQMGGNVSFTYSGTHGTTLGSCGTNICHNRGYTSSGSLQGPATAYSWGTALTDCNTCHLGDSTLNTFSHPGHLTSTSQNPLGACADCHTSATATTHMNQSVTFGVAFTYTSDTSIYSTGKGTCGTNACHNKGYTSSGALQAPATTYTWGSAIGAVNTCTECHLYDSTLNTFSHTAHLTSTAQNPMGACTDCHAWASATTHLDRSVSFGGAIGFTYASDTSIYSTGKGTCGTNACHTKGYTSSGALAAPVTVYTWGSAIGAVNTCTECHLYDSTLNTFSHPAHLTSTVQNPLGACSDCHASASATTHLDRSVSFGGAVAFTYASDTSIFSTGMGTCSTNACHTSGAASAQGVLGAPNTVYTWGTAIGGGLNSCTECHATGTDISSGSHSVHIQKPLYNGWCSDCHAYQSATTHIDRSVTFGGTSVFRNFTYTSDVSIYSTGKGTCGTNTCHEDGKGGAPVSTYTWGSAMGNCFICHAGNTSTWVGPSGAHNRHPASAVLLYCSECHTSETTSNYHLNGLVDFGGGHMTGGNYSSSTGLCTNNCHLTQSARSTWTSTTSLLACGECHASASYIGAFGSQNLTSGHGVHVPSLTDSYGVANYCGDCHWNVATEAGGQLGKLSTHIDGTWQKTFKDAAIGTITFDSGHADIDATHPTFTWGTTQGKSSCGSFTLGTPAGCHGGYNQTGSGGAIKWSAHQTAAPVVDGAYSWNAGCIGCHSAGSRPVMNNFDGTAPIGYNHHIKNTSTPDTNANGWTTAVDADCKSCHGDMLSGHNSDTDKRIWVQNPSTYEIGTAPDATHLFWGSGTTTAPVESNTSSLLLDAGGANSAYDMSDFCLMCHGGTPVQAFGDGLYTTAYAWDGKQVGDKYSQTGTDRYSPYDSNTYNVTPAYYVTKANSPHFMPGANKRGIATTGAWSDSGGSDTTPVHCLHCHNAHASDVGSNLRWEDNGAGAATVPSYSGALHGILISSVGMGATTTSWRTYHPTADAAANGPSAEADVCFDCHLGTGTDRPRTYGSYGVTAPITDYFSGAAGRWRTTDAWDTQSFTYKTPNAAGRNIKSTHWLGTSAATIMLLDTNTKGMCTPCHDPHGVTTLTNSTYLSVGDATAGYGNRKFPLLRGNWLTSPYKEDRAGDISTTNSTLIFDPDGTATLATHPGAVPRAHPELWFNNPPNIGGGYGTGISGAGTYGVGSAGGHDGYFIDDNTWGVGGTLKFWWTSSGSSNVSTKHPLYPANGPLRPAGTYTDHAGLCSVCHTSAALKTGAAIQTLNSLHNTVKGIQGTAYVANVFIGASAEAFSPDRTIYESGCNSQAGRAGGGGYGQYPHGANGGGTYRSTRTDLGTMGTQYKNVVTGSYFGAHGGYNWGWNHNNATPTTITLFYTSGGLYHRFTCSKCHVPHSQSLGRLMRTNCMETSLNNDAKRGNAMNSGAMWNDTNTNACHGEDYSPSWNAVTPWHSGPASTLGSFGGFQRNGAGAKWPSTSGFINK